MGTHSGLLKLAQCLGNNFKVSELYLEAFLNQISMFYQLLSKVHPPDFLAIITFETRISTAVDTEDEVKKAGPLTSFSERAL